MHIREYDEQSAVRKFMERIPQWVITIFFLLAVGCYLGVVVAMVFVGIGNKDLPGFLRIGLLLAAFVAWMFPVTYLMSK